MPNDRSVQAWRFHGGSKYLEAASASPFNPPVGGSAFAAVLFKLNFDSWNGGDLAMPEQRLWGNSPAAADSGWWLELGADSNGNPVLRGATGGPGGSLQGLEYKLGVSVPGTNDSYVPGAAERLILAVMHFTRVSAPASMDAVLYVNGNPVSAAYGVAADRFAASALPPRVGLRDDGQHAARCEIVGVAYSNSVSNNVAGGPPIVSSAFRYARENNRIAQLVIQPNVVIDWDHKYNCEIPQPQATPPKLVSGNGFQAYDNWPVQGSANVSDEGNQGLVAIPGVSPVALVPSGDLQILTTRNPDWFAGGQSLRNVGQT